MSGAIPPFPHISLRRAQDLLYFHVNNCLPYSQQAPSPFNSVRGSESDYCTIGCRLRRWKNAGLSSYSRRYYHASVVSRFNIHNFDCEYCELFM